MTRATPLPRFSVKPFRHDVAVLQRLRDDNVVRDVRDAVVVAFQKGGEDFAVFGPEADQGKGLLADHPTAADEESGNLRQIPFPVETEDVPVPAGHGDDPLPFDGFFDGRDPVPEGGRLFEAELFGRLVHPGVEVADQRPLATFEKGDAVLHETLVGGAVDPADAGGAQRPISCSRQGRRRPFSS